MLDIDKEILTFDISDEALEIAAGEVSDKANFPWGLHWPVRVPRLTVQSSSEGDRREAVFLFHANVCFWPLADMPFALREHGARSCCMTATNNKNLLLHTLFTQREGTIHCRKYRPYLLWGRWRSGQYWSGAALP